MKYLVLTLILVFIVGCKDDGSSGAAQASPSDVMTNYYGKWTPYYPASEIGTSALGSWCDKSTGEWVCTQQSGTTIAACNANHNDVGANFELIDATTAWDGWNDNTYTVDGNVFTFLPNTGTQFTIDFYDNSYQSAVISSSPGCSLLYVREAMSGG